MDYSFRLIFRHRALAGLIGAWTLLGSLLFAGDAPDELTVIDHGQRHTLVIADREIDVARRKEAPLGELRHLVERVPGTKVVFDTDTRALVQLGAQIDRARAASSADDVSTALPDAEIQPVLYLKGAARTEQARRYGTNKVLVALPPGKTPAQLAKEDGAIGGEATSRPGLAVLQFATPFKALKAVQDLRAAGVGAQPMLAQQMQKRSAVPLDQFFPDQWHLVNIGQGGGAVGIDLNVLGAWDFTLGSGRTIAIVDDCLQTTHPDLTQNCPPIATNLHHDFIDNDSDPRPGPNDQHGTSCAGVAAARQNNGVPDPVTGKLLGVSGVAPDARLLGLRLIAGPFTDDDSASALFWHPVGANVDVSSNSWGPIDGGGMAGPDILTTESLKQAANAGRGGLGQVTVWAAGNGLGLADNSNFDGYANSRYVTAVSAITNLGVQAPYSEPGANILVCAPSDGGTLSITTTDLVGVGGYNPPVSPVGPQNLPDVDYTNDFGGTSAACPMVAGGAALIFESNPNLGWRDVREILASTARKVDNGDAGWNMSGIQGQSLLTNGGGFHFNDKYGAGLVDLAASVALAKTRANLGPEVTQEVDLTQAPTVNPQVPAAIPADGSTVSFTFDFGANPNLRVEVAALKILISTQHRSDLEIELVSPSGVRSVLSPRRLRPAFAGNTLDPDLDIANWVYDFENGRLIEEQDGWTFTATHYWGDNSKTTPSGGGNPSGVWTLTISNFPDGPGTPAPAVVNSASLILYGTPSAESRVVFDAGSAGDVSETAGSKTIRVRRLGPLTGEATVDYATTIGSAVPDNIGAPNPRYTPVSGTLHFSVGQVFSDTDIVVPILDDNVPELTQTVNVVLLNPTNASLGSPSLFTFGIIDNEEDLVTVTATDPIAAETLNTQPPNTGTFTIQRQLATDQPLTVSFTLSGTATMGTGPNGTGDYQVIPLFATIPAFATSVDVVITPRDDTAIEGTESVIMTLNSDPSYQLGVPSTAEVDILDNDLQKVQITLPFAGGDLAAENPKKTTTVRITRERADPNTPPANPLTVLLAYGGTQINGVNYTKLPDSVIIPAGADFVDLIIDPIDDSIYQATKTVVVSLRPSPDYDFQFGFLTSVTVRIIEDDPIPDTHIPTVTISAPKPKSQYPAPQATFLASGTASDNHEVDKVEYQINGGGWQLATLTGQPAANVNWTADILSQVQRGTNLLNVKSVDDAGNESKIAASSFEYVELHTLAISANPFGTGTFTKGFAPESSRESGHSYTVTATAATGQVFDHWSGLLAVGFASDTSTDRTLTFTMPTADVVITANFITSPFTPAIAGNYSGLIEAPDFATLSSGFLKFTVSSSGYYTGQVTLAGTTYPVKGDFTGGGLSQLIIPRNRNTSLVLALTIDTTDVGGTRRITGTLDAAAFVATVVADRAAYSKTSPAPAEVVKSFNLIFPPASPLGDPIHDPHGTGYGTAVVAADGSVKFTGTLADGTKVSLAQPLTKDKTWPLFLNLYGKQGVMLGNVTLDSTPADSDLQATVNWQKPTIATNRAFPIGFRIVGAGVFGSIYTAPPSGTRALDFDTGDNNGVAVLTQGNLQSDILRALTLDTTNIVTVANTQADPNTFGLNIVFNVKKGTFSGKFRHPVSQKQTVFNGVLFQKRTEAVGQFQSPGVPGGLIQSGTVTVEAAP